MDKVSENPFKNRAGGDMSLMVVTALFVTLYLVSNVMAVKVITLFDLLYFDAGTITFPFAYMLGDVLTEIWGYRTARKVIWLTFLCNVIMVVCTQIGVWLPSVAYLDPTAMAYNTVFTYVPRIVLGSLAGFLLGELSNAWLMERIKVKTKGRFLWVRTIGSSVVGYVFDTLPFVLIAFAGILTVRDILLMIAVQYFMKLVIEVLFGTPMAYAVIVFLKRRILKMRHSRN
ncbi:MAG: queuosine precursor transporter [Bacteroidaceae bacterium]|nr:queuosine precursor transporter [Bacteroidaceae bacterium]